MVVGFVVPQSPLLETLRGVNYLTLSNSPQLPIHGGIQGEGHTRKGMGNFVNTAPQDEWAKDFSFINSWSY
jgi:hypothetical protein